MAESDVGEKSELPSERRRQDARQKGNVARSVDLNAAGVMLAAATAMLFFGEELMLDMAGLLQQGLSDPTWIAVDHSGILLRFRDTTEFLLRTLAPTMMLIFAVSLALNLVQVGFLWAPEAVQPQLSRLNPLSGMKRLFSMQSVVKLGVSLGKLGLLAGLAAWYIDHRLPELVSLGGLEAGPILSTTGSAVVSLAYVLSVSLIVLAVLDFGYQRWKHEKDLMMTKQEVREEMKEMDGDPLVRQRRREAHRKLAQARELQQVKDADVVITNPTHISVALKYDPVKMGAPVVVAKGMGEIALRIREIAAEHGIPILERKPLARALYRDVKVGRPIPVEMYEVFVEIMAYVYRLTGRTPPALG